MDQQQDDIEVKEKQEPGKQSNEQSLDRKLSSSHENVDNGENAVSNGTQANQPGIATVGNTGPQSTGE